MGVVWRAQDQVIGRQVALKEVPIPPGIGGREREIFLERVLREARTAGRLNDPAVVTVFDVTAEHGSAYIVMELVEAPTLADLLARGPLPDARVREIARQVIGALRTAHAAGIVHRDVKPSNIMVLPGDRVKLADFGIARAMDDPALTTTGMMGSPGYMAPELFSGASPGPASDLWALGATLFHAVEGQAPFTRTTTAATLHAIMFDKPRPVRAQGALASVVLGLLNHDPDARLTAGGVLSLLGPASGGGDPETTDVLSAITDETHVVAGPTAVVAEPRRPTRPAVAQADKWDQQPEWDEPAWDEPRKKSKRTLMFAGAAGVVVAGLAAVFLLVPGKDEKGTAAPQQVANEQPATTTTRDAEGAQGTAAPGPVSAGAPSVSVSVSVSVVQPSGGAAAAPSSGAPDSAAPSEPGQSSSAAPTSTKPARVPVALIRYNHPSGWHYSGTGAPPAGFSRESALGSLVKDAEPGTRKLFACQVSNSEDRFTSTDQTGGCEGQKTLGFLGYIFTKQVPGTIALQRCNQGGSHFDSRDPNCEGKTTEFTMGYLLK
ncbi:serine/threonine-protein kinase [Actinokineospora iranica]